MHPLKQILNAIPNSEFKIALTEGFESIFEVSWDNIAPGSITANYGGLGGYQSIMKQVAANPSAGGGAVIDRSFSFVNDSGLNTRDTAEETREQWATPKYGPAPIKSKPNAFMKRALSIADKHMPVTGEVDIPSAQRRYAMIYPMLNTGVNQNSPGYSLG